METEVFERRKTVKTLKGFENNGFGLTGWLIGQV
jgi:hypothetical protein